MYFQITAAGPVCDKVSSDSHTAIHQVTFFIFLILILYISSFVWVALLFLGILSILLINESWFAQLY